jgi:hypothetical protein
MKEEQLYSLVEVLNRIASALETLASTVREGQERYEWTDEHGRKHWEPEQIAFIRTGSVD